VCAHKWYACTLELFVRQHVVYSRITTIKSPSFCMTTFSDSLANVTLFLIEPHDYSYYISRRKLAHLQIGMLKNTDLRAYDIAHSPYLWLQPTNVNCAWRWKLCGNYPATVYVPFPVMTLHLSYDWVQKDVSYSPQFLQNQMILIEKKKHKVVWLLIRSQAYEKVQWRDPRKDC